MAYSTSSDVASLFKGVTFDENTTPTATEVDAWIAEADALIDAKVGLKYVVPIVSGDSPISVVILKTISKYLVAPLVADVLRVKTKTDELNQGGPVSYGKKALKMLDEIVAGKMLLSDATLKSSADGVSSYNDDYCVEHTYKMNTEQW